MNRWTFALFAALTGAAMAAADLPRPQGQVTVTPRVCFAGMEKYPDYVFCVQVTSYTRNIIPPFTQRFEVKNAAPFSLTFVGESITDMDLLALGRQDFEQRRAEDPTLKWLSQNTPNVLWTRVVPPSTVGRARDKEVPVTEYSVAIVNGKLTAAMQDRRKISGRLKFDDSPLRPWIFGIACSLSLAFFGVWLSWRKPKAAKSRYERTIQ